MNRITSTAVITGLSVLIVAALGMPAAGAESPWASGVVEYDPGDAAGGSYTDQTVVIGEPHRTTTGYVYNEIEDSYDEIDVSVRMTETLWRTDQLLAIGNGGRLVVTFDHDVLNDSRNPYGTDLLVFGNVFFTADNWPELTSIIDPSSMGGIGGGLLGTISVSQDNVNWYSAILPGVMMPMQAYISDSSQAHAAGAAPSDYTRPVNPDVSYADFAGLTLQQALDLYNGSGGGLGIDLSNLLDADGLAASLDWIRYVKIEGLEGQTGNVHAFSDVAAVPEPMTMSLLAMGLAALALKRRRR